MNKIVTYFNTPALGISDAMKAAIKRYSDLGYAPLPITTTLANYPGRALVHLHEPRYAQHLASIRGKLKVYHVHITHVDGEAKVVKEEVTQESEASKGITAEQLVKDLESTSTPTTALPRPRRSSDAPVYVSVADKESIAKIAEATVEKGNRIKIYGSTVNDLPAEHEIRFDILSNKLESFEEVRAVATGNLREAIQAIAAGLPTAFLGALADPEAPIVEFLSGVEELLTASVASTEKRQAFLDSIQPAPAEEEPEETEE